jgi:hypothetical protein
MINMNEPAEQSHYEKRKAELKENKGGRPSKKDLAAKKPGGRGKVGRPKGDAAIMEEYRSRMLASPKSKRVLDTIFAAALDDEHKGQTAAWKLVMDRVAPVAGFEKQIVQNGGRSAIQINITGVSTAEVEDKSAPTINTSTIDGNTGEILQD